MNFIPYALSLVLLAFLARRQPFGWILLFYGALGFGWWMAGGGWDPDWWMIYCAGTGCMCLTIALYRMVWHVEPPVKAIWVLGSAFIVLMIYGRWLRDKTLTPGQMEGLIWMMIQQTAATAAAFALVLRGLMRRWERMDYSLALFVVGVLSLPALAYTPTFPGIGMDATRLWLYALSPVPWAVGLLLMRRVRVSQLELADQPTE